MSDPDPTILRSVAELECMDCGLTIRVGDEIVLGTFGWVHPVCGELEKAVDR